MNSMAGPPTVAPTRKVSSVTSTGPDCDPATWTCPKCGQTIKTLVRTYNPWCANPKHRREIPNMIKKGK